MIQVEAKADDPNQSTLDDCLCVDATLRSFGILGGMVDGK